MNHFREFADDYYVNMNLATVMDLSCSRETVLHYFDQISKRFPEMRNFYQRDKGNYILEQEKECGQYNWCSLEPRRICSGCVNPERVEDALQQHTYILDVAPYSLSISPLDCEVLDFLVGFDFNYRGNHNALLVEALGIAPAFESLVNIPGASIIGNEPTLTIALDNDCRVQCRVSIEARTSAHQIRTGEFPEDQLSVYVTARLYEDIHPHADFAAAYRYLAEVCFSVINTSVVENILEPLAKTIAIR